MADAYNPAVTLGGIYPKEVRTYVPAKTCTRVFAAAIRNCQNVDATKTSPVGDGQIVTLPDDGRVFGAEKKRAVEPREGMEEP